MAGERSYTAGRYTLELDGKDAGVLASAVGGDVTGDVISMKAPDGRVKKHLGGVKYTDLEFTCGSETATRLMPWLTDTMKGTYPRKNGAFSTASVTNVILERLEFTNALLVEVGFPGLDASSKDPALISARLTPEHTRRLPAKGKATVSPADKQKQLLAANFRLTIDGLDCTKVTKIEPLVIRLHVPADGGDPRVEREPPSLEIPDLVVTLAQSNAQTFIAWHEDFVIRGNCTEANEKTGTLELLSASMTTLFTLGLRGLGIYKLVRAAAASTDSVAKLTASIYCQEITTGN